MHATRKMQLCQRLEQGCRRESQLVHLQVHQLAEAVRTFLLEMFLTRLPTLLP